MIVVADDMDFMAAIAELNTVALAFDASGPLVAKKLDTIVVAHAHLIEGNAKKIAPVDTGALRSSISTTIERHAEGQGYETSAEIGPTVNYGQYPELGTSRMAPRAYMGPSLDRYSPSFVAACEAVVNPLEKL